MSYNFFISVSISPNRKWLIVSILILILYEHLISFTQSLRFLCNYASLRNAELVRKEEALYLRFFTQELKMRKFAISCCGWNTSKDMKLKSMTKSLLEAKLPKQLLKREFSRHLKIGTRWNFAVFSLLSLISVASLLTAAATCTSRRYLHCWNLAVAWCARLLCRYPWLQEEEFVFFNIRSQSPM